MRESITPATVLEFVDAVRSSPEVNVVGACTKPRLAADHGTRIATTGLHGIVEYDPSEFTITALAGTTLRELTGALAERGQYLPFDPLLVDAGATLGGTVAAGLNGPGCFRYGGLRDFILGVRFIDGSGRLLRAGGKVVKNAAGFDLPKFFVGSLGRFGALVEFTFKVFPRPAVQRTLEISPANDEELAQRLMEAGNTRWEIDALDADGSDRRILLRLAAAPPALDALATEILGRWPGRVLPDNEAAQFWTGVREFHWTHTAAGVVDPGPASARPATGSISVRMKIATTPKQLPTTLPSLRAFDGARIRVSAGGNVLLLSLPDAAHVVAVGNQLRLHNLSALTFEGDAPLFPGARPRFEIEARIKAALDPVNRFPGISEQGGER